MKKENVEKQPREYQRLPGNTHGVVRQKMMNFRLDNDNAEWIAQQPNKGRYLNNLIAADRIAHQGGE